MPTRYRGAAVGTVNVAGGGLGIFASSAGSCRSRPRHLLLQGRVAGANEVLTRLAANRLRLLPGTRTTGHVTMPDGAHLPRQRVRLRNASTVRFAALPRWISVVRAMTFGAQVTITTFMPTIQLTVTGEDSVSADTRWQAVSGEMTDDRSE